MQDKVRRLQTEEEIKIFADPYRTRIIKTFSESPVPMTVTQAAKAMGEVPANVHYHLKKLLKIEVLELDHIQVIKGINAKYYKLVNESYLLTAPLPNDKKGSNDKQIETIKGMIYSEVAEFRKDIEEIPLFQEENSTPGGLFWKRDIYLSKEEFSELSEYVKELMTRSMVKDDSKQKYSSLIGLFIKETKNSQ